MEMIRIVELKSICQLTLGYFKKAFPSFFYQRDEISLARERPVLKRKDVFQVVIHLLEVSCFFEPWKYQHNQSKGLPDGDGGPLAVWPTCWRPLKGNIPNTYPLCKVYMGLKIKGTIRYHPKGTSILPMKQGLDICENVCVCVCLCDFHVVELVALFLIDPVADAVGIIVLIVAIVVDDVDDVVVIVIVVVDGGVAVVVDGGVVVVVVAVLVLALLVVVAVAVVVVVFLETGIDKVIACMCDSYVSWSQSGLPVRLQQHYVKSRSPA